MDPASHFLLPLIALEAYSLRRYRRPVSADGVLLLLLATQLPDLVDKPLAWWFGITPSGRWVAHSLVVALPVVAAVVAVSRRLGYGPSGHVFAFGYLSHIAADLSPALTLGTEYYYFPNFFWPLLAPNPDPDVSFAGYFSGAGAETFVTTAVALSVCTYTVARSYRRRRKDPG